MHDSLWTFGFEIANFVGLAAVLAWLFFKPVRQVLDDQRAATRRAEEETEEKLAAAQRIRDEVEREREQLADEFETLRKKAREAAQQDAERILAEARAAAARERDAAKRRIGQLEQTQTSKLAKAVAVAAQQSVNRLLQQVNGPDLERMLLHTASRELKEQATHLEPPILIETAKVLEENQRQLILGALGDTAHEAEFRVVPALEGGVRITTGRGLIDASIVGLADFAEQALRNQIEITVRENSNDE